MARKIRQTITSFSLLRQASSYLSKRSAEWGKTLEKTGLFAVPALLFLSHFALAQAPQSPARDSLRADSIKNAEPVIDTIQVQYYFPGSEQKLTPYSDTTLHSAFHQYNPLRRSPFEWMHLGNTGSEARPVFFNPLHPWGPDLGFHGFDGYFFPTDSLPFYRMGRALTDTYFSFQGQTNTLFEARFARQFKDGFQASLKYRKINQFGQFLNQTTQLSALVTGLQYRSPNRRYRAYLIWSANSARAKENGGLATDSLFFKPGFERAETQPIRLDNAQTLQLQRQLSLLHFYRFRRAGAKNFLELYQKLWTGKQSYKFYDKSQSPDTAFYGSLLTDPRGVRQWGEMHSMGIAMGLSFKGIRQDSSLFQWLPTVGLSLVRYDIRREPETRQATHLSVTGNWEVQLGKALALSAYARLALSGYAGDYAVGGELTIRTGRAGEWQLNADFQNATPSLLAQKAFITQVPVWQNDFKKELVNRVGGKYRLPQYRFEAGGYFSLLTHHIYYGTDTFPAQYDGSFALLQLFIRKEFRVAGFGLDNSLLYQKSAAQAFQRPALYARQQLYWQGRLFKKALELRTGLDLRYFSSWQVQSYQPAIGQFYNTRLLVPDRYGVDFFTAFRVQGFRFFAKVENLQYFWTKEILLTTYLYPAFKPVLRLGVGWLFRD